jgi:hypothetical protein
MGGCFSCEDDPPEVRTSLLPSPSLTQLTRLCLELHSTAQHSCGSSDDSLVPAARECVQETHNPLRTTQYEKAVARDAPYDQSREESPQRPHTRKHAAPTVQGSLITTVTTAPGSVEPVPPTGRTRCAHGARLSYSHGHHCSRLRGARAAHGKDQVRPRCKALL